MSNNPLTCTNLEFLKITGVLHILTSILFFVYLTEKKETKKLRMTVWSTYKKVWKILSLKRMKQLLLVIVTYSVRSKLLILYETDRPIFINIAGFRCRRLVQFKTSEQRSPERVLGSHHIGLLSRPHNHLNHCQQKGQKLQ